MPERKLHIPPYALRVPQPVTTPVIFASPHSGCHYPEYFQEDAAISLLQLRSSEDAFVDQFMRNCPDFGAISIAANYPRAFLDLNRDSTELDPGIIAGLRCRGRGNRVAAGLGVIPRVVAGGRAIRLGKITLDEARERLDRIWAPWHARIADLMQANRTQFGHSLLIDLHSMPNDALSTFGTRRPDIVIGDRYGASASPQMSDLVAGALRETGLRVSHNSPFAGAYITQRHGRPAQGLHVLQIEINRALYMNEATIEPNQNFAHFADVMDGVLRRIAGLWSEKPPLAAE
ncbi:N-formylglutamate amidohydrolase [Rhodobacteraceae bacterium]|nr:N-formylglutamate amidohydrolase [Paracoccaceae bacterium]